jgi:hypothetical protein
MEPPANACQKRLCFLEPLRSHRGFGRILARPTQSICLAQRTGSFGLPEGCDPAFYRCRSSFERWRTTRGRADQAGCAGGQSPPGSERSHKSPGRKSGDTGSLGSPGSAWHAGRRSQSITAGTAEVSSQWLFRHHALRRRIPQPGRKIQKLLELPPIPAPSKTASQDANRSTSKLRLPSENGRMPCFA